MGLMENISRRGRLVAAALLFLAATRSVAEQKYPLDTPLPGPKSPYTKLLVDMVKKWPPKAVDFKSRGPAIVRMVALETPGHEDLVGVEQHMRVDAPLARVQAVLDDIDHYKGIFPGYEDIHVVEKDGNKWLTFWEQNIPFFLVSNNKYEMTYVIDTSAKGRVVYRYQLKEGNKVKTSDGVIVIEDEGPGRTRYTEYDFFEGELGLLKTLAPGRIWKDTLEGVFLSDAGVKLKAEHPDWSDETVRESAKKAFEKFPLEEALKHKKVFYMLRAIPK